MLARWLLMSEQQTCFEYTHRMDAWKDCVQQFANFFTKETVIVGTLYLSRIALSPREFLVMYLHRAVKIFYFFFERKKSRSTALY